MDRSNIYRVFPVVLIGALLLTCSSQKDTLTYTDENSGYKIDYNPAWEMEQVDVSMVFSSPKESEEDAFQEAVNVVVQDLSEMTMTLDELTGHMKEYLQTAEAAIVETGETELGGTKGRFLVVTGKQGELELKMMQVYTIADNRVYIVTFTAEQSKYDAYLEDARKMIDSFEML